MNCIRTGWIPIVIFILSMIAAVPASAQTSATAAANASRALAAYGPGLVSGAIQDWICEGTLTLFAANGPKATLPVNVIRKGKAQVQRLITQGPHLHRQGSDGTVAWDSVDGFRTVAQGRALLFLEAQSIRSIQALLNHQSSGLVLQDAGQNGNSRVLEALDANGRKTTYRLDINSSLVTEIEFTNAAVAPPDQATADIADKYVLSDYRRVQGILTPFKIERYINGTKVEEMQFSSVRYNASVKDSDFKP